jgi:type II secretory pathway pseudopilin PulG
MRSPLHRLSNSRQGFTLIELLVLIGILAVLVGLILAGVQKVRARTGEITCKQNLHQIGQALHLFHDSHGTFPSSGGFDWSKKGGVGWTVTIPSYEGIDGYKAATVYFGLPNPRKSPVQGRVMYRSRPVLLVTVTFVPDVARGNLRGRDGRATTAADGSFTLQTYPHGPGVMPGAYRVTVLSYSRTDQLPRKYTKFHLTPLTAEVTEEGLDNLVLTIRD